MLAVFVTAAHDSGPADGQPSGEAMQPYPLDDRLTVPKAF